MVVTDHNWIILLAAGSFCWLVYVRVVRIKISARSAVMQKGKIIEVCLEGDRRMIWDRDVFWRRIVCLECDEVDGAKYVRTVIFPVQGCQVCICDIVVTLEHIMHRNAWQRFYDMLIMSHECVDAILQGVIDKAVRTVRVPLPEINSKQDEPRSHISGSLVNVLNASLKPYGLLANVKCMIEFTRIYRVPRPEKEDE